MAMGGRGRREAENAIASCRPFRNSTGSLRGTRGSTRDLGWLEQHTEAQRIRELLSRATYVVWSYNTPISWVSEDEDGERTAYYVDDYHSMTTSHHQGIARCGLGEYETIGARPRTRRPRPAPRPVNQGAIDRANATVAGYAEAARREPTAAHVYAHRDPEAEQQASIAQMLDPRYGNPDWTPWLNNGSNLPPGADDRDEHRVQATGGTWTP